MNEINVPDIVIVNDKKEDYYRTINLSTMFMDNLSWKAKGLFYYIRTRPDKWKINTTDLINKSTDGEASVRAGIKELIEANLLYRFPIRDDKKKIIRWIYISLAKPQKLTQQDLDKLLLENLNIDNLSYSNNINSNKNIDTSFNKLKESIVSEKKLSSSSNKDPLLKKEYHERVYKLFNLWQDLNIIKHRDRKGSKTKETALYNLNKFCNNRKQYGFKKIKKAFNLYKKLLEDPYSKLENSHPYKVGLNEFFGFSNYTKDKVLTKYPEIKNIKSWFHECLKGLEYMQDKYSNLGQDHYPDITKAFKKQCEKQELTDNCNKTMAENTMRTASYLFMDYVDSNKKRFYNGGAESPILLVKDVVKCLKYIREKNREAHRGWLSKDFFYTGEFERYLINQDMLKPRKN